MKKIIVVLFVIISFSYIYAQFAGGDGSEGDPYQVSSPAQLNEVRNYLSSHFIQTADISLNTYASGEGWQPIGGYSSSPFTGVYDGGGYSITQLTINPSYTTEYLGLFAYVSSGGSLKNVRIQSGSINNAYKAGALVGYLDNGSVNNCYSLINVTGESLLGGLIGRSRHSTITNSYSTGRVFGWSEVGGLIGYSAGQDSIARNYATGNVFGSSNAGGLIGTAVSPGHIERNYATGNIESYSSSVSNSSFGGLLGYVHGYYNGPIYIKNNYATGNVTGNPPADYIQSQYMGGFIGKNAQAAISNSYSTGAVTGTDYIGGFCGGIITGGYYETTNCYWDTERSNISNSFGGTGKTTQEMKTSSTFSGWDFSTPIWEIESGSSYPFLDWQATYTLDINVNPDSAGGVTGQSDYPPGFYVTVEAIADPKYEFSHWSDPGAGSFINANSATATYIMPGEATTITANFELKTYNLTVVPDDPSHGSASDISDNNPYSQGSSVSLSALANPGYRFTHWTSSGGGIFNPQDNVNTFFTMPAENVTITANFVRVYELAIESNNNDYGDVLDLTGNGLYPASSTINIAAVPETDHNFIKWTSDAGGVFADSLNDSTTFTMPENDVTITAHFNKPYNISLFSNGNGSIQILDEKEFYYAEDQIELVAEADSQNIFCEWYTLDLELENTTKERLIFTMPDNDVAITAVFYREFDGGDGSEGSPWQIGNEFQLNNLRNYLGARHSEKHFTQTNDIDLTKYLNWKPIGSIGNNFDQAFYGSFFGNEFKISDLTMNDSVTSNMGLFGVIKDAELKNIEIFNSQIIGTGARIGLLVGYNNGGTILSSSVAGTVNGTEGSTGGLIGGNLNGHIEDCSALATVSGGYNSGGLVGTNDHGTVSYSFSAGEVSGVGVGVGGLIGANTTGKVENCFSETNVQSNRSNVGGLIGSNYFGSEIRHCYSKGNVNNSGTGEASINTGGLVGINFDSKISNSYTTSNVSSTAPKTGGFAGANIQQDASSIIEYCYSAGSLTGTTELGGFISTNEHVVNACLWDVESSGEDSSAAGSGANTASMKADSIYIANNWDLQGIWGIDNSINNSYPYLFWQTQTPRVRIDSCCQKSLTSFEVYYTIPYLGNSETVEHGVCWDTKPEPKRTLNSKIEMGTTDTTRSYMVTVQELDKNKMYYIRAFAEDLYNNLAYSHEFQVDMLGAPVVAGLTIVEIDSNKVRAEAEVTDLGNPELTQHGFAWLKSTDPVEQYHFVDLGQKDSVGKFSVTIEELQANTNYYIIAYAINLNDTAHTDTMSFKTYILPEVQTINYSEIDTGSVKFDGYILHVGNPKASQHGFCWSLHGDPSLNDNVIDLGAVDSAGAFVESIDGLLSNTKYYFRAYASNVLGTVYGDTLSYITLEVAIDPVPKEYSLAQNYPNPFNPTTTIKYGLPEISDVKIVIYDIMGRKINQWKINNQKAGWHKITWVGKSNNGNPVPSGLYIYSIQANDFMDTRKMLYMK